MRTQRRSCFDNNEKGSWECQWPEDLQAAGAQLKLLTNCPTEQMQPTAYTETKRPPTMDDNGGEWDWPGGSWCIDACAKPFICSVTENNVANCQPPR